MLAHTDTLMTHSQQQVGYCKDHVGWYLAFDGIEFTVLEEQES